MSDVYYEQIKDGKVVSTSTYICFANLLNGEWKEPDVIKYIAPIDGLTNEEVSFYLEFLAGVLGKNLFTSSFVKWDNDNCVSYELNVKGMDKAKILMYLTAFRYITEYSHIVKELYNDAKEAKSIKNKFKKFMDIHCKHRVSDAHSLTYAYSENPHLIDYDNFMNKLNGQVRIASVHNYFKNDLPPVPKKIYQLAEKDIDNLWGDVKRY
jgi:hypothetical protein